MKKIFLIILALMTFVTGKSFAVGILPMTPVYESSGFKKKFIGVQIPYEALKGDDAYILLAHAQLRLMGLYTYPFLDKIHVNGEHIGSGILGTVVRHQAVATISTCIGLCMSYGGGGDVPVLQVGSEVHYGIKMDWTMGTDLREKSGLWIEDPIGLILKEGKFLVQGDSAMDIALKTARYGNYRLKALERDANSLDWPKAKFNMLAETTLAKKTASPQVLVTKSYVSKSLAAEIKAATIESQAETQWQQTLKPINDIAPLWNNKDATDLVQSICDAIHKSSGAPEYLKPRCGVFASLTPNVVAYPGGDIFISTGLLGVLPNVDTLIFFLSHEYGHVIARHATKKMSRQDYQAGFFTTLSLLANVVTLGKTSSVQSFTQALGTKAVTMEALETSIHASLAVHTREDEDQADLLGIEMAMNLGANHYAVSDGLKALEEFCDDTFKKNQQSALDKFMTADHRELGTRTDAIAAHARRYAAENTARSPYARSKDREFTAVYRIVKPLTNYYRLQLKSQ